MEVRTEADLPVTFRHNHDKAVFTPNIAMSGMLPNSLQPIYNTGFIISKQSDFNMVRYNMPLVSRDQDGGDIFKYLF